MPVLIMLGEKEFAFPVHQAEKRAKASIFNLNIEVVENASHLIPVSKAEYYNQRMIFTDIKE